MIKISVIIPTFNRQQFLKKLLTQLDNQKLGNDLELYIIVVNDGSSDGTSEMLIHEFGRVITIQGNGSWWWTRCVNEGIKMAINLSTDFILLLNDDNEIKDDYIISLIRDYKTLTPGAILGSASISLDFNRTLIDSSGIKDFSKLFCEYTRFHPRNSRINDNFYGIHECFCFSGRGTLIPRDTLLKLGLYDEKMIQYGSDEDYILTAKEKGFPVFITWNTCVYNHSKMTGKGKHPQNMSLISYLSTFFNKYTNKSLLLNYYFYSKHCYPFLAPIYILYYIVFNIGVFFLRKQEKWATK
jgi:GT2 family glycosyltransferase